MSSERPQPVADRPVPRARVAVRPAPADRARAAGAVLAAVLLALAAALLGAGPAHAHNSLLGTDPEDGSSVPTAPERVTLTFDQPAQALGTEVVVVGPDGATVSTGSPELVDSAVTQPLVADRPAGAYTVQWRVTSADGHPLSGELTFTAEAATGGAAGRTATDDPGAASVSPEPMMTTQGEQPDATPTQSAAAVAAEDEDAGLTAGAIVAIVVAVLAAGAVVAFVVHERRRSRDSRTDR